MKNLRWILPCLALVLFAPGCILTSGQFTLDFDLPDITATSSTGIVGEQIDLNDDSDYKDHKDNVKDISDFAVLGTFHNTGTSDVNVEVYMTRDLTTLTDALTITTTGIKLWGPFKVPANGTKTIDWDASAALFTAAGKAAVLQEAKGDGNFTLYAVGSAGTYQFDVENGKLVLVIDVGI
ncbi:MAG TPA: hypothetical protein VFM00_13155 [Candidatus Eisenbacteria bacterium]|nr:hypothetical protein [Candidatus Eisenbacteria bacterium]